MCTSSSWLSPKTSLYISVLIKWAIFRSVYLIKTNIAMAHMLQIRASTSMQIKLKVAPSLSYCAMPPGGGRWGAPRFEASGGAPVAVNSRR